MNAGINVNYKDYCQETALSIAINRRDNPEREAIVKLILDKGADPNAIGINTSRPLFLEIQNESRKPNLAVVKMLLDKGANVNNKTRQKPLLHVVLSISFAMSTDALLELVKILINKGADVNSVDQEGNTALNILMNYTVVAPARRKILLALITILIKRKVDVNQTNHKGKTPVVYAISLQSKNVLQLLLEHGAKVCVESEDGKVISPLDSAIVQYLQTKNQSSKVMLEYLLQCGASYRNISYTEHCR